MKYLVFDVESIGLHGQGFAVGGVILDTVSYKITDDFLFSCPPNAASGTHRDLTWVKNHIPDLHPALSTPREVRRAFCWEWEKARADGARLAADCPWPVEARFLIDCYDQGEMSESECPYPLVDINSLMVVGLDNPDISKVRLADELPVHNPLADARQSARALATFLQLTR